VQQQRDFVLHAEENTAKVDVDDSIPVFLGDVRCRCDWLLNAGIVEREVKTTMGVDDLIQRRLDVLAPGDVTPRAANASAVARPMPLVAPVTNATLPANSSVSILVTMRAPNFPPTLVVPCSGRLGCRGH
jgi:hypothetical protein